MTPVNIDELNEIMDNDEELIRECFQDFMDDYPEMITELKTAVSALDYDAIDNAAHKIKGALRYLAAGPAAQSALTVETAGRNRDPEHLDNRIAALESQCTELLTFIRSFSG